ncbi:olfactory receptor 51G2-like [Rhinatrema bivittatum]|uniref:olfactory receptor 51G2-like n=1 Tax=Rhinatrema bivittatum TaxID=194408 RepID=UPI001126F187|nr:olfactory receptor 51G2-like [Rhinatrema bivittatum]
MSSLNNTIFTPSTFILVGIPGLETAHIWTSFPMTLLYVVTLLGNCTLLFIIKSERSLHAPMYIFLSMLAVTDLGLSMMTSPTVISVFWFNSTEILVENCLMQMFFIHSFSIMESSVLMAMAFDRFIAICNPLRYTSILTSSVIAKIGIAIVIRGIVIVFPIPFLLKRFLTCRNNVLSHAFCLHPDIMKMVCSDHMVNSVYSMFAVLSTMGLDAMCIILSYVMILRSVFGIASVEERFKAFNACVSHICVVLFFYGPMIVLSMVHKFGENLSPLIHVFMAYLHFLLPPAVNPIVYGIKTKEIYKRILRKVHQNRVNH